MPWGMSELPGNDVRVEGLHEAIVEALRPIGLRQRLKRRFSGGMTAVQVLEGLPLEMQYALQEGPENLTVAKRQAIHAVTHSLFALSQRGQVKRETVRLDMKLPGKGLRGVKVDVYKLT